LNKYLQRKIVYYLKQLPSDRLLGEVYEVDKSLFIDGHRSWQKFNKINQLLTDQHSKVILNKLQHLSTQEHQEHDNKLHVVKFKFCREL
jgi:hypothetical protein